jgi:putative hemolysin
LAVLSALAGLVLAALYNALGVVARGAVEEIAARHGNAAARQRVERVLDDTASHARAVGLLKVACDVILVVSLVQWVASIRGAAAWGLVDVGIGLVVAVVVLWLSGVVVPMAVANHAGARMIYGRSMLLRLIERGASPLSAVAQFLDEVVRRLVGAEVPDAGERVQAELLSVVEEGEQQGALDELERDMIEGVMRFSELTVSQIMTPRTEVESLEYSNNLGAVIQTIKAIGHSRIPVYEGSMDHVVGIFYVKDLMRWLAGDGSRGSGQPFELRSILRPATFVPETKTVRELLREMIQKKVHIAMVADEYGGTAGLVTIEDIVEQIVGDIKDEYEAGPVENPQIVVKAEQRRAEVEATARLGEVNDALAGLGVEIPTSDEYDTVGGFVITTLGRIPQKGEQFDHERLRFTILEAKPTRVVKVLVDIRAESGGQPSPQADGVGSTRV